jgi:hypothetical protein
MTGYHLEVVVTNLDKNKTEFLSHETVPELSCVEAVLMSMSLPLFFQTYIYKNNIYIDGAITDPFPIHRYEKESVIGILLQTTPSNPKESFFTYMMRVIDTFASTKERNIIVPPKSKVLKLEYQVSDTVGLKMSFEDRVDMVLFGYFRGYQFYEELNKSHPEEYPMNISKILSKDFFKSLASREKEENSFILDYIEEISQVDSEELEDEGDEYLMELFESSDITEDSSSYFTESSEEEYSNDKHNISIHRNLQSPRNNTNHSKSEYYLSDEEEDLNISRSLTNKHLEVNTDHHQIQNNHISTDPLIKVSIHTEQVSSEKVSSEQLSTEQVSTEQLSTEQVSIEPEIQIEHSDIDEDTEVRDRDLMVHVRNEGGLQLSEWSATEEDDSKEYKPMDKLSNRSTNSKNNIYSPGKFKKWKKHKKKHKTPEWITKK